MATKPMSHSPDSGVHEPRSLTKPENGGGSSQLEEQDLTDLHEDILDENEENVRQLLREVAEEGLSVVELIHTELQVEPLQEDHPLNRISLSALHRAALLESNSILTLLLTAAPDIDANLPLKDTGYTPLHVASLAGVPAAASYLTFNGAKVDVKDKKGHTPIHLCSQNGHVDIAKVLVVKGGQLDCQDELQRTPLHYACEEGHMKFVAFLLKKNVEIDAVDHERQTPLHRAVLRGQDDIVEALLGSSANSNHQDHYGNTPLHILLANAGSAPDVSSDHTGDYDYCLELLLAAPHIDIHLPNAAGHTPLHVAASHGYLQGLRQLLAAKADINAHNSHQETPLFCVRSKDALLWLLDQDRVDLEAKDCDGNTALHKFAGEEAVPSELLDILVARGADVKCTNDQGETALLKAGYHGNLDKVRVLLDNGAQRDDRDIWGRTVLHVALERGHSQVATHLLQVNNIKVNLQDTRGHNPLHLAMKCGEDSVKLVKTLVEMGVDINARDETRQRPADIALRLSNLDALRVLLKQGAKLSDVNNSQLLVFNKDDDLDIVQWLQKLGMGPSVQNSERRTLLHLAVLSHAWELCLHLILNGARCDLADIDGNTPLHLAAVHCQRTDIIDELVTNSTSINKRNIQGNTPLHTAVLDNTQDIVETLVQLGAKLDVQNKEGCSPLHVCCNGALYAQNKSDTAALQQYNDKLEFLLAHVDRGDPEIYMMSHDGSSVLHYVCQIGDKKLAQVCLQKGALVDKADDAGMQPLHYACASGSPDIVALLLNQDANVDAVDSKGETPLFYAVAADNVDIVEELLSHEAKVNVQRSGDKNTALHQALQGSSSVVCEAILMQEPDPNLQNTSGQSALHMAAKNCGKNVMDALLALTPDLALKDNIGRQAIHYAVLNHDVHILKKLIKEGCAVNATDDDGNTPLLLSCKDGSYEHMSLLLECHADVNKQNHQQVSVLHYAIQHEETDLVELLIANEADPNTQDSIGQTPLLCALAEENLQGAQLMLDYEADLSLLDSVGESALHKAVRMQKLPTNLLRTLARHGCDYQLKSKDGESPLDLLKARQDIDVEEVLQILDIND